MAQHRRVALQAGILFVAMSANAAVQNNIRIKILDSETHSFVVDDSGVPKNCDQVNFDAYCHNSKTTRVTNTLLVQEGDNPPFRVSCTIESKWSRCIPLNKGETVDAKREKHGITVYYVDDKGKARKQLYTLVESDAKTVPPMPAAAVATQPMPAAHTVVPAQNSPAPLPAPPPAAAQGGLPAKALPETGEKVRCSFSSTPSGADITVDGKYVGNTPSEIAVSAGAHVVVFSLAGFVEWKRELTVAAGSGVVNVTATLQKTLP